MLAPVLNNKNKKNTTRRGELLMTFLYRQVVCLFILVACTCVHAADKKDPRKKDPPRKHHVKRIQCDVCHHMSKNLYNALIVDGKKKRSEEDVIEYVERSTTAWRTEGEWITHLHLTKSWKGFLGVKDMKRMGECGEACRTIEYAAQKIMGEYDADIGEALYTKSFGKTRQDFDEWMCVKKTKSCDAGKEAVPVEEGFVPYPAFQAKDPQEQNIERVLGEMADQGLRGNMFTREEAMEKYMAEAGLGDSHYDL